MPRLVTRTWHGDPDAPGGRSARRSFDFEAYLPDRIASVRLLLPGDTAAALARAENAVRGLDGTAEIGGLEAVCRQLLRAESIASSRIEGLKISQRHLARAAFLKTEGREVAQAVMGNVAAMEHAVAIGERSITVPDVLEMHRLLLEGTPLKSIAGHLRASQNWIGGSDRSPRGAEFVPPPEWEVEGLIEDLCDFSNRSDVPPVAQAAIAHAQFETIHPFADGNGRVGRALIHALLRRTGVAPRVVPPISLVLATNGRRYVEGLTAYREGRAAEWLDLFARALESAAEHARSLAERIRDLKDHWREDSGHPRPHSAAEGLIKALPAHPVMDVRSAAAFLGVSFEAANNAVRLLEGAGVLRSVSVARRNRAWEARELLDLLDDFEWELATPTTPNVPRRPTPGSR